MYTISGVDVYPNNGNSPTLYDIGWGLARTCRFAGQTKEWYPVLAHVYTVTELVSGPAKIHALLHDSAEAIVGDQVATWKNHLTEKSEDEILDLIYKSFGIERPSDEIASEVKTADIVSRSAEAVVLGHSKQDEHFFQVAREEHPDMYFDALHYTRGNQAYFTPIRCCYSIDTDKLAREFEAEVTNYVIEYNYERA